MQLWGTMWVLGPNWGPLKEQPASLTAEPSLQSLKFILSYTLKPVRPGGKQRQRHCLNVNAGPSSETLSRKQTKEKTERNEKLNYR